MGAISNMQLHTESLVAIVYIVLLFLEFNNLVIIHNKPRNPNYWLTLIIESLVLFIIIALRRHYYYGVVRNFHVFLMSRPWSEAILFMSFVFIHFAVTFVYEQRKGKRTVDRETIKEAVDTMSRGMCIFNKEGNVKLYNQTMYNLAYMFMEKDLQVEEELAQALENIPEGSGVIKDGPYYIFPDETVWRFRKTEISAKNGIYTEYSAEDVTELYVIRELLKEKNAKRKEISSHIRELSKNIVENTTEQEILEAKSSVHSATGQILIALRQDLEKGNLKEADMDLDKWSKVESLLEENPQKAEDAGKQLELLTLAAKNIGVSLEVKGEMPEDEAISYVIISAIRECLTNSVRHGKASEVICTIEKADNMLAVSITNNGALPKEEIKEGGGLSSVRKRVTKQGGTMTLDTRQRFALKLTLPEQVII